MIYNILFFILGLVFLVKGSDYFSKSAGTLAKKLGVSEFVIGLTLVAIGTSIPELISSIIASIKNESGIIIGNVIGSNIANIGLIVGISALIMVRKTNRVLLRRDGYFLLLTSFLLFLFSMKQGISRFEAFLFLLLYVSYLVFLFTPRYSKKADSDLNDFIRYFFNFKYITTVKSKIFHKRKKPDSYLKKLRFKRMFFEGILKDVFVMIISGIVIIIGANYVIDEAVFFANLLNIPNTIIALSLISLGTSIPELSVSVTAALKGYKKIAIGNIIGSNIVNILLIIGVSGLIHPLEIAKQSLYYIGFMIIFSIIFLFFVRKDYNINKLEGLFLLIIYILFILSLFFGFF